MTQQIENLNDYQNIANQNSKQITKLNEEIENLTSELLTIKRKELEKLTNQIKDKLDAKFHDYLDILLESPAKSPISNKAKANLTAVNDNNLQRLVLFQYEVNNLENKLNNRYQAQIEVLPP